MLPSRQHSSLKMFRYVFLQWKKMALSTIGNRKIIILTNNNDLFIFRSTVIIYSFTK